jgi:hypothetical protein
MDNREEIRVPVSRRKLALAVVGSAGFVVGCAYMLFVMESEFRWILTLALWVGLVFFSLCFAFAAVRLCFPYPALHATPDGVTERSSAISAGFIPWREVRAFHVTEFNGQMMLSIELHDPEHLLGRVGRVKASLIRKNLQMGLNPVLIPQVSIADSVGELATRLNTYHRQVSVNREHNGNADD